LNDNKITAATTVVERRIVAPMTDNAHLRIKGQKQGYGLVWRVAPNMPVQVLLVSISVLVDSNHNA
jgi:hypothetical protein